MSDRPKILIVDDEPNNHRVYERILEPLDLHCTMVLSGQQALGVAHRQDFFLILMDVQMPGMDGFETASLILSHPKTSHIPVIFITAFARDEAFEFKGYESGAVDYLVKPINDEILLSKVGVFLQLYEDKKNLKALLEHRQISEERLQAERDYSTSIIERCPAVVVSLTPDGICTYINPAGEDILGYDKSELLDINWWETIYPGKANQQVDQLLIDMNGGQVCDYEMIVTCKNGGKRVISWTSLNRFNKANELIEIMGFGHDVTERKQAELALSQRSEELLVVNQALQQQQERLEEMVSERTQELEASVEVIKSAKMQLVESEKMALLGRLVAGMSHELNTPIGICVTAISYLQEITAELDEVFTQGKMRKSDLQKYFTSSNESAEILSLNLHRASDLISNFKLVSVDMSNELTRKFNLRDYLGKVLKSLHPALKRGNHQVVLDGDEGLVLDTYPGVISQIITNLVMNSLTHGYDEGESARIVIAAALEGDLVQLDYQDDGKGMATEVVEQIFEPFFTTRRGAGGSGLGMYIIYNLVSQNLGGQVRCTSEAGQGAHFCMTFPVKTQTSPS